MIIRTDIHKIFTIVRDVLHLGKQEFAFFSNARNISQAADFRLDRNFLLAFL